MSFESLNLIRRLYCSNSLKIDIDECELKTANCGPDEICKNKPGGYTCSCPVGHTLNAQRRCEDVNECDFYKGQVKWLYFNVLDQNLNSTFKQVCSSNSDCVNTIGSYRCECKEGFRKEGTDEKVCIDINECNEVPGMCEQRCINYWGSYRCGCETGFRLSDNNRTCEG